jgi:hypothetical protein
VEVLKKTGDVVKLKLVRYHRGAKYEQLQQYTGEVPFLGWSTKCKPCYIHWVPLWINLAFYRAGFCLGIILDCAFWRDFVITYHARPRHIGRFQIWC